MRWLLMVLTPDDEMTVKGGAIVQTQMVPDGLVEDTPALLHYMRSHGWDLLADVVERERGEVA